MRAMPIRIITGKGGFTQMKASFQKNWIHYLQEALGLAIFMISACFFGALLESKTSSLHQALPDGFVRMMFMGVLMGATALFIFYAPWTSPSGAHINPAVTLTFWRLGKMCPYDALFFIIFQFAGGTIAVFIMQWIMGNALIDLPVNSAVTIPGKTGIWVAFCTEFIIAFITMSMVLFTSAHQRFKKYTRVFAGCLVCCWVIIAAPLSGFGMNPARSFASALPAHNWTAFWIYLIVPVISMLLASEVFLYCTYKSRKS
jgi:aquaporin Z